MATELRCPFCETTFETTQPRRSSRTVQILMFGFTFAFGSTACGPVMSGEEEPAGSGSSGAVTVLTTSASSSGAGPLTSGPTPGDESSTGTDVTAEDTNALDDSNDQGCSFYAGCPPDDWGGIDFECDVFAQDCPEGEKCMGWANDGGDYWNATRCTPIAEDPAGLDEPCTVEGSAFSGIDDCGAGLMCFGVDPKTNEGHCEDMCVGDDDDPQCAEGEACGISGDGALVLCLDECNPLLNECGEGEGCYPSDNVVFTCMPSSAPDAVHGSECDYINGCGLGQICVDAWLVSMCEGAERCCADICSVANDGEEGICAAAAGNKSCVPFYEKGAAEPGLEDVGACIDAAG